MQSYQLDLLDEKALVILRGLEQLRIITLRPLNTDNGENKANNYDSTEQQHDIAQEPVKEEWKTQKGSVTSPSTKDVDVYLKGIREDSATSEVQEPGSDNLLSNFKKFRGSIDLNLTRNEIDVEIEKSREGWL